MGKHCEAGEPCEGCDDGDPCESCNSCELCGCCDGGESCDSCGGGAVFFKSKIFSCTFSSVIPLPAGGGTGAGREGGFRGRCDGGEGCDSCGGGTAFFKSKIFSCTFSSVTTLAAGGGAGAGREGRLRGNLEILNPSLVRSSELTFPLLWVMDVVVCGTCDIVCLLREGQGAEACPLLKLLGSTNREPVRLDLCFTVARLSESTSSLLAWLFSMLLLTLLTVPVSSVVGLGIVASEYTLELGTPVSGGC